MSDIKIITLASLGEALVAIVKGATAGTIVLADLESFKAGFDAFCAQSPDLDQAKILSLTEENEKFANQVEQYEKDQADALKVIASLKGQLKDAMAEKALLTPAATREIDGVAYKIVHGAYPYSAKDLETADESVIREILAIDGQQAIVKL